jgi:hypothetical protein
MDQSYRADTLAADEANNAASPEFMPFLVSCAICSLLGLTVLAILAQSLVAFLAQTT